jgi:hypothetical protein
MNAKSETQVIRREILGHRAFNWGPESCQPVAKALVGLDLLAATVVAGRLHELLGVYALDELEKEIWEAKGAVKT